MRTISSTDSTVGKQINFEQNYETLHAVVSENVSDWRNRINSVLVEEAFDDRDVVVHQVANAVEAVDTILELQKLGLNPLWVTDLHMDPDGEHPEYNGDSGVAHLSRMGKLPQFVIASGTHTDERKLELITGPHGLNFVDKDAFLDTAGKGDRDLLIEHLRRTVEFTARDTLGPAELQYLEEITKDGLNITGISALIDEIKPKAHSLWSRYKAFMEGVPGADMLKIHGLHKGNSGANVHEFKNKLKFLRDAVTKRTEMDSIPDGLLKELSLLQSYINLSYGDLEKEKVSTDIVLAARLYCRQLSDISAQEIEFTSDLNSLEVSGNTLAINRLLYDALQNAILHGFGSVEVHINNRGIITISNDVQSGTQLGFTIQNGEVVEGAIPDASTSVAGSGTGLRGMLQAQKALDDLSLHMSQEGNAIFTSLQYTGELTPNSNSAEKSSEVPSELPNIVFLCHDGTPELTFQQYKSPEYNAQYLHLNEKLFLRGHKNHDTFVRSFLQENHKVFADASLVVVHTVATGLTDLLPIIQQYYPHIVLLPASSEPDSVFSYDRGVEKYTGERIPPEHTLSANMIQQHIRTNDPATAEEVCDQLYRRHYSSDVWDTIVAVSQRIALEKLPKEAEDPFALSPHEEYKRQQMHVFGRHRDRQAQREESQESKQVLQVRKSKNRRQLKLAESLHSKGIAMPSLARAALHVEREREMALNKQAIYAQKTAQRKGEKEREVSVLTEDVYRWLGRQQIAQRSKFDWYELYYQQVPEERQPILRKRRRDMLCVFGNLSYLCNRVHRDHVSLILNKIEHKYKSVDNVQDLEGMVFGIFIESAEERYGAELVHALIPQLRPAVEDLMYKELQIGVWY